MVKFWKIFFATAVIFISGYVAGYSVRSKRAMEDAHVVDRTRPPWERPQHGPRGPHRDRDGDDREFRFTRSLLDKLDDRLDLTETERENIGGVLEEHRKNMRDIWGEQIRPIMDQEMERVKEATLGFLESEAKRDEYLEFVEEARSFDRSRGGSRMGGGPRGDRPPDEGRDDGRRGGPERHGPDKERPPHPDID